MAQGEAMTELMDYDLRGPGIEFTSRGGDFHLRGDDFPGGSKDVHIDAAEIEKTATDIGTLLTIVLLEASRNNTKYTLSLLLPETALQAGTTTAEVTGVAIVTHHYDNVVGGPPPVRKVYRVVSLEGTASRAPQVAAADRRE
jgi:hypothetical protein